MLYRFFLSFALAANVASASAATWSTISCKGKDPNGVPTFLAMTQTASGDFYVENEETRDFLIGLRCQIPSATEPGFYCTGRSNDELSFFSALVVTKGFTEDSYGTAVHLEQIVIHLHYDYIDGGGKSRDVKRVWKFNKTDCDWR